MTEPTKTPHERMAAEILPVLHTGLRKGVDGPYSSLAWNLWHDIPDAVLLEAGKRMGAVVARKTGPISLADLRQVIYAIQSLDDDIGLSLAKRGIGHAERRPLVHGAMMFRLLWEAMPQRDLEDLAHWLNGCYGLEG